MSDAMRGADATHTRLHLRRYAIPARGGNAAIATKDHLNKWCRPEEPRLSRSRIDWITAREKRARTRLLLMRSANARIRERSSSLSSLIIININYFCLDLRKLSFYTIISQQLSNICTYAKFSLSFFSFFNYLPLFFNFNLSSNF